ncbi:MAG: hypothetical protein E7607_05090 [Ruminococcaceae bacterium]|nr:hypothetical protein [Oscillospiraceae bacterium]
MKSKLLLRITTSLLAVCMCISLAVTFVSCSDKPLEDTDKITDGETESGTITETQPNVDNDKDTGTDFDWDVPHTKIELSNENLEDKIAGSWVGQMVGVSWAASTEFKYKGTIIPENEVPVWTSEMVNNAFSQDDLYVEVPFMDAMKDHGIDATVDEIAPYFRDSDFALWHANYFGRLNLQMGIEPSMAGHYLNSYCADDIDWQIESDFLGNIYPGMMSMAGKRAFEIGHLINYGDGVYGGVFVSVMHSAAFVTDDLDAVIDAGIGAIPEGTKFRKVMDQVVKCYEKGMTWEECWSEIESAWGTDDKCPDCSGNIDAKLNAAYILIGLLWGEGDFEDSMVISMRCGQDSDCNPSSVAAVLGALYGLSGLPEKYVRGVNYSQKKFSYTDYTLQDCIDVNTELAREALTASGAVCNEGVWTVIAETEDVPVPFEQWPDDILTVYMDIVKNNNGVINITTKAVAPKGESASDIEYSFDMGDGVKVPSNVSSYKYLNAGVYTITCTAKLGEYTAKTSKTVDLSDLLGDRGFKITPTCSETSPWGAGSKDISVITDGYVPTSRNESAKIQYDTYKNGAMTDGWFALNFDHTVTVSKVLFTEGVNYHDGGWFKSTPTIEVLIDGVWKKVDTECSPKYVETNTLEAQGDPYETFVFTLKEEIACRGIRITGEAGGNKTYISCAELNVEVTHVENPTYEEIKTNSPTENAIILVSISNPSGEGNKNISVIADGVVPNVGNTDSMLQYDTYRGNNEPHEDYYGYIFREEWTVSEVVFTEGKHFHDGGWFKSGTLRLQLFIRGEWIDAEFTLTPDYPNGNAISNFGQSCESYTFKLTTPAKCSGIRIIGEAGGVHYFTSISELAVKTA